MITGFLLGVCVTMIYGYIKEQIFIRKLKKAINKTILRYTNDVDISNMSRSAIRDIAMINMLKDTDE